MQPCYGRMLNRNSTGGTEDHIKLPFKIPVAKASLWINFHYLFTERQGQYEIRSGPDLALMWT